MLLIDGPDRIYMAWTRPYLYGMYEYLDDSQFIYVQYITVVIVVYFQELVSRTALETHKLDLMAEISTLKLKLATCDKDRRQMEDKLHMAQVLHSLRINFPQC